MTPLSLNIDAALWVNQNSFLDLRVSDDVLPEENIFQSGLSRRERVVSQRSSLWHDPNRVMTRHTMTPDHTASPVESPTLQPWTEDVDFTTSAAASAQMMEVAASVSVNQAGRDLSLFGYSFGSLTHLYSAANNERQYRRIAALLEELKQSAQTLQTITGVSVTEMAQYQAASFLSHPQHLVVTSGKENDLAKMTLKILLSRIAALEAALLAYTQYGVGIYIFESGVAALADGTCGVFKKVAEGLVLCVSGMPTRRLSSHAIFADEKTTPAIFDYFASREGGFLYWKGRPYRFLKDSSGTVAAIVDRENRLYDATWDGDKMQLKRLLMPLALNRVYKDVNGYRWLFDGDLFHWSLPLTPALSPDHPVDVFIQAGFYMDRHKIIRPIPLDQAWRACLGADQEVVVFEKQIYTKAADGFYYLANSSAKYALVVGLEGIEQLHFLGSYQHVKWVEKNGIRYAIFPEIKQAYYFMSGDGIIDAEAIKQSAIEGYPLFLVATENSFVDDEKRGRGRCRVIPAKDVAACDGFADFGFVISADAKTQANLILLPDGQWVRKDRISVIASFDDGGIEEVFFTIARQPPRPKNTFIHDGIEWEMIQKVFLTRQHLVLARPKNTVGDECPWRLFEQKGYFYELAQNGFYQWVQPQGVYLDSACLKAQNGNCHIYVKNGWVWDLNNMQGAIDVLPRVGVGTVADPENHMVFIKKTGDIRLASVEQIQDFLRASHFNIPENYINAQGRLADVFYHTPIIDSIVLKGIVATSSVYSLKVDDEILGAKVHMRAYELTEIDITSPSGMRQFTYYIPDPDDSATLAAREAGYYIPDKDDIRLFHERMNQVLPRADVVVVKTVVFYPTLGLNLNPTNYTTIFGWYNASNDTLAFYQKRKGDRDSWLDDVTGATLVHEVSGHGRERGLDPVRKFTLMAMILDGLMVAYNKTWRESFSVLGEFMYWVPALQHRFPNGFPVNYTLVTAADREYLGAGMLIAVGDQ